METIYSVAAKINIIKNFILSALLMLDGYFENLGVPETDFTDIEELYELLKATLKIIEGPREEAEFICDDELSPEEIELFLTCSVCDQIDENDLKKSLGESILKAWHLYLQYGCPAYVHDFVLSTLHHAMGYLAGGEFEGETAEARYIIGQNKNGIYLLLDPLLE